MPKADAEALLRARVGNDLCIRFFQRADGTILTEDCPVGVKKKRRRSFVFAVAGVGAMAAAAATMLLKPRCHHSTAPRAARISVGEHNAASSPPLVEKKGEAVYEPVMGLSVEVEDVPTK
jgi:hypothetical protein